MGTTFRTYVNQSSLSKENGELLSDTPQTQIRAVIRARLRSGRASEQVVELTLLARWLGRFGSRPA